MIEQQKLGRFTPQWPCCLRQSEGGGGSCPVVNERLVRVLCAQQDTYHFNFKNHDGS